MTETSNPEQGTGLVGAANAIEAFLAGEADNQTPQKQVEASKDAPVEEDQTEALNADAELDETPPEDAEEADDEGADEEEASADDEDDDAEEGEAQFVTVKIDGKAEQVPLDEVIAGYQRTADYTRKTQALAKERAEFQSEAETVQQERQQYAQLLTALTEQLQSMQTQEPDWDRLYNEDPLEYVRQKDIWRDNQEKLQAAQYEQQRIMAINQQQQAKQLQQIVEQNRSRLLEQVPAWSDKAKWEADRKALREYGIEQGFSDEELNQAYDSRAVVALYKAMKYDRMMAKRPQKAQPSGPKVAKGGSSTQAPKTRSELTRAKQRLAKTGSVDDAAQVFLGLI